MGMYINPGNEGFTRIVAGEYVDKTGLIALVNDALGTTRNLIAVTRPRRFGKSFAAESLVAYYSCGCDSRSLFDGLAIGRSAGYETHLNKYNVVHLDMTAFKEADNVVTEVTRVLLAELRDLCPDAGMRDAGHSGELTTALIDTVDATSRQFVFVIDEWDAPLRERKNVESQEAWVFFMRLLFKNATFTAKAVAAAYITGILPIKRYGTQSALSDFREYTMLGANGFAPYVGLTEDEVEALATDHGMDMDELRHWYDGYELTFYDKTTRQERIARVYAPFSVIEACHRHQVGSYWTGSEAFEALRLYIDLDFDGLQQTVVQALGGASVVVRTGKFDNDMHDVSSADDVLTLLCHLGYLAFDARTGTARVPNEEVRAELQNAVAESRHPEVARIVRGSDALLAATWDLDADEVASLTTHAHDHGCAPQFYNNEQALRAVVRTAYISAADHYATIEELPSGRGVADVVYLPRHGDPNPAMVVELKWDKTPGAAIAQIHDRDYPATLRDWGGPLLLVGISYNPKTKEHRCTIEQA